MNIARRKFSFTEMEVFLAVVRELNFSRAAEHCCTTQPALSVMIRELERKAGAPLLLRSTRRMSLTPAGEQFHLACRRILDQYDDGISQFQNFVAGHAGTLVVAASPSIMAGVLPKVLQRLNRLHPDIKIEVRERLHEECLRLVREKDAHCAITAYKREADDLDQQHLCRDRLVLICPATHELAAYKQVKWQDVVRYPQVSLPADSSIRQIIEIEFIKRKLKFQPLDEVERFTSLLALVASQRGIGVLPGSLIEQLSYRNLRFLPILDMTAVRSICLITARGHLLPPALEHFRAVCLDELATDPP